VNLRNSHQVDKLITRKFELLFQYLVYMHRVSFFKSEGWIRKFRVSVFSAKSAIDLRSCEEMYVF
jgi:hypothetical protein